MVSISLFTVFVLGLRHGADPDHLAAIDNLTRSSLTQRPGLSRFVGTLFAIGHSTMVLAIAALVGLLGTKFQAQHMMIETVGTIISIVVLIVIAGLNIAQLRAGGTGLAGGLKFRLIPPRLRASANPFVSLIVGFLFGFGFETSSQIATYAFAFGTNTLLGALLIGGVFSLGMIVTDTLDSVLVYRLVSAGDAMMRRNVGTIRIWISTVTLMALAVAMYEAAQLFGWQPPFTDSSVSVVLVGALFVVFVYVFIASRKSANSTIVPS